MPSTADCEGISSSAGHRSNGGCAFHEPLDLRSGERPTVDFENEIVLYIGEVTGSCTNILLTGFVIDRDAALVEPSIERPLCRGELLIALPHTWARTVRGRL